MIAAESVHFYLGVDCEFGKRGDPLYTFIGKNGKQRPITLADVRKNPQWQAVPSVTEVLKVADKPGLDHWRLRQMLEASLTLPRFAEETLDEYAQRVIIDSQEQGRKAAERGTLLHTAIEKYIQDQSIQGRTSLIWESHLCKLDDTLKQYGIDIFKGKAEHSFASPLGFGGKIDWHNDETVLDFKTKDTVADKKQLAWPEHCWQLAAYCMGLSQYRDMRGITPDKRLINVFIGCDDCEVRIHEWSPVGAEEGWHVFRLLLEFWNRTKRFGEFART